MFQGLCNFYVRPTGELTKFSLGREPLSVAEYPVISWDPRWGAFVCLHVCLFLFHLNVKTPVPDITTLGIVLNPHFWIPVVFLQSKKALKISASLKCGEIYQLKLLYFSLRREVRMLNQSESLSEVWPLDPDYSGQQRWWQVHFHPAMCPHREGAICLHRGRVLAVCGEHVVHRCVCLISMAESVDRASSLQCTVDVHSLWSYPSLLLHSHLIWPL